MPISIIKRLQATATSDRILNIYYLQTPILKVKTQMHGWQQETLALVMDKLSRMSRFVDDLILLAKAERPALVFCVCA